MASKLTKSILFTSALALVVAGGYVIQQEREKARVLTVLEEETDAIVSAYRSMADMHVFPSENSTSLTQEQRKASTAVREVTSKLSQTLPLSEKVDAINALQLALIGYARASAASSAFAHSTATVSLQQSLSEKGSVVELLRRYNETARTWNDFSSSPFGSVSAQMLRREDEHLPSLRFDGEKAFLNIIEL